MTTRTIRLARAVRMPSGAWLKKVRMRPLGPADAAALRDAVADPEADIFVTIAVALAASTGLPATVIGSFHETDLRSLARALDDTLSYGDADHLGVTHATAGDQETPASIWNH
jgi:hypothetical protein